MYKKVQKFSYGWIVFYTYFFSFYNKTKKIFNFVEIFKFYKLGLK